MKETRKNAKGKNAEFLYDEEKREIEFERDTEDMRKKHGRKCEEEEFEENCKKITEDLEPKYNITNKTEY